MNPTLPRAPALKTFGVTLVSTCFPHSRPLRFLVSKDGHGLLNVRKDFSAYCTSLQKCCLRGGKNLVFPPVSTWSRSGWINVEAVQAVPGLVQCKIDCVMSGVVLARAAVWSAVTLSSL